MPIILPAVTLDATGAVEGLFFGMGRDKMGWFARGQASSEGRGMVGATREREEEKKRKKGRETAILSGWMSSGMFSFYLIQELNYQLRSGS